MDDADSYFRPTVAAMDGYVPGEQPKGRSFIKLNTNESQRGPSQTIAAALSALDPETLRLYPDPLCDSVRDVLAEVFGVARENIIAGNGSDDILTIVIRAFVDDGGLIAYPDPTYSLYPVLARIQNARSLVVPLDSDFSLPKGFADSVAGADLVILARPNAPTGVAYSLDEIESICAACLKRKQAVLIDEAYADFADDHCVGLISRYPNVIVSRTMSKSYALAGIRFGWAIADAELIAGMMKVKDSYNVNRVTQVIAEAAARDQARLRDLVQGVRTQRAWLLDELGRLGFRVTASQANFVFVSPPTGDAAGLFSYLRENGVLTRYFPAELTQSFLRITVGTKEQNATLLKHCGEFVAR